MAARKTLKTRAYFQGGFIVTDTLLALSVMVLLALVGMYSYANHIRQQGYSKAESTLQQAWIAAEEGIRKGYDQAEGFTLVSRSDQSVSNKGAANEILAGFQVPDSVRLHVYFDPSCTHNACESLMIQADDCQGGDFARYTQYGDGLRVVLEGVPGSSCRKGAINDRNSSSPIYSQLFEALS